MKKENIFEFHTKYMDDKELSEKFNQLFRVVSKELEKEKKAKN